MDMQPNFFEEDYEKCRIAAWCRDEPILLCELLKAVMEVFKGEKNEQK